MKSDFHPATTPPATAPASRVSLPQTKLGWLALFGPGAVIASLTIGAGELIFSSRAGALFGYRLLWFFGLVLLFKWALVFATARHMVLTGAHPFQRWLELPGPRGWLPMVLFVLGLICFPIWVGFHAGTTGTLVAWFTNTQDFWQNTGHYLWGIALLTATLILTFTGGYNRLEKIQLAIILVMLFAVIISVFLLNPDWLEVLKGILLPRPAQYPDWVQANSEFAQRPVWLETITYVGVIGGSGYDYLAYVSYLRDKNWGQAGRPIASPAELARIAEDPNHPNRQWIRGVAIDCGLSFIAVLLFAAVFVICGAVILQPLHKVPSGTNLLTLQAEFVTPVYPWLKYLYFTGAFLAIAGTLYGTIEVAPTVLREMYFAANPLSEPIEHARLRRWSLLWVSGGGLAVLLASMFYKWSGASKEPPALVALLTPANLFTGVLACGIVCGSAVWMDWRFLPRPLRMNRALALLNLLGAVVFTALGFKGYWDYGGWRSLLIFCGTLGAGWLLASGLSRRKR
jgi:hypothetical protein